MYIELSDPERYGTRRLRDPDVVALLGDASREDVDASDASSILDDPSEADVEFTDEGRARVRSEIGELLAEKYDHIQIADREDSGGEE